MLYEGTLLTTNYGVFKVKNLAVGMKVPAKGGWSTVAAIWGYNPFTKKFKIETEIGGVIVDSHQNFFQDSHLINVSRLHKGSKIDTFYGETKILKYIPFHDNKKYYTIKVNNYNSNYYIHNGIQLSR